MLKSLNKQHRKFKIYSKIYKDLMLVPHEYQSIYHMTEPHTENHHNTRYSFGSNIKRY